jgi:hypothetical protein
VVRCVSYNIFNPYLASCANNSVPEPISTLTTAACNKTSTNLNQPASISKVTTFQKLPLVLIATCPHKKWLAPPTIQEITRIQSINYRLKIRPILIKIQSTSSQKYPSIKFKPQPPSSFLVYITLSR